MGGGGGGGGFIEKVREKESRDCAITPIINCKILKLPGGERRGFGTNRMWEEGRMVTEGGGGETIISYLKRVGVSGKKKNRERTHILGVTRATS